MPSPEVCAAPPETAALVALLRAGTGPPAHYSELVEQTGSARVILEEEQGLLAAELIAAARAELRSWTADGLQVVTLLDDTYPENLRAVHDRPPLLFLAGSLQPSDARAVAVIGSRSASPEAAVRARVITEALMNAGYTIVSGLAAGVDTVAHTTALERAARTIAVIGTGLHHSYPAKNRSLQQRIAAEGAVISQFWPESGPRRDTFPARNAVMSGIALATIIVAATYTSGARIQARHALAHGRPVLLVSALLEQPWARQLAERPGVHVMTSPAEVVALVDRLASTEAPVA